MGSAKNTLTYFKTYKYYIYLIGVFVFSLVLFRFAYLFQSAFDNLMSVATYLTWHSLFEFAGIVVSFAVFVTSYYTYNQTRNLRFIFLGAVFLFMGQLDLFHTLSYKGMPEFFVSNVCCANRATTFWIISRIFGSVGIALATFIPKQKETRINRVIFAFPSIVLSIFFLIVATYYPDMLPRMYIEGQGLTQAKIIFEYVIVVFLIVAIVKFLLEYKRTSDSATILFVGGLLLSVFSEFAFIKYNNPYDIHNYIGHVYKVLAFYFIFKGTFITSVQRPYMELSEAKNELRNYAENLDRLVSERTKQLKEMNQVLLNDLDYARDIQRSMLPQKLPREEEVSFAASYFPAERVSGDFYNIFKLDDQHIGFYIGDVSGHGVPAAMLTVFLKQSIKTRREVYGGKEDLMDPSATLKDLYESFNNTNFKDEVYIVLLYGIYNFKTRELTYASAGLNVAPLLVKNNGQVKKIQIKGFPICKFMDFYSVEYENNTIKLEKGDRVLFYTDGLVEVKNDKGEEFSEDRLIRILENNPGRTAPEVLDTITRNVFDFINISQLRDDITFFVMKVD